MALRRRLSLVLVLSLWANAFASPAVARPKRLVGYGDNELDSSEEVSTGVPGVSSSTVKVQSIRLTDPSGTLPPMLSKSYDEMKKAYEAPQAVPLDDDDDDEDDFENMDYAPTNNGGSNLISLLNLGSSLLSGSSGTNVLFRRMIRSFIRQYMAGGIRFDFPVYKRRMDTNINEIDTDLGDKLSKPSKYQQQQTRTNNTRKDYVDFASSPSDSNVSKTKTKSIVTDHTKSDRDQKIKVDDINTDYADLPLQPPKFERQETDEENDSEEDSNDSSESEEDTNNAAEESKEDQDNEPSADASNASADNSDNDSDEPPGGGDGQGGGVLGLLAGLSGGEDGQSDLGSLLAAVSGIVANLSGDGFDLNALIASGLGLFVGLLSEGEENPGAVISSYLLTSLDTITGGGAKNNGEFLGTFLSKLIKGTSAGGDPDASSEENGGAMPMADSAGFFLSFLMGLSGDMSKGSSGSSSHSSW